MNSRVGGQAFEDSVVVQSVEGILDRDSDLGYSDIPSSNNSHSSRQINLYARTTPAVQGMAFTNAIAMGIMG